MSLRLPSLQALVVFETSARLLSFTKAAGELNVTPVAVSRMVARLEDALGFRLFERTKLGLTLTDRGATPRGGSGKLYAVLQCGALVHPSRDRGRQLLRGAGESNRYRILGRSRQRALGEGKRHREHDDQHRRHEERQLLFERQLPDAGTSSGRGRRLRRRWRQGDRPVRGMRIAMVMRPPDAIRCA